MSDGCEMRPRDKTSFVGWAILVRVHCSVMGLDRICLAARQGTPVLCGGRCCRPHLKYPKTRTLQVLALSAGGCASPFRMNRAADVIGLR